MRRAIQYQNDRRTATMSAEAAKANGEPAIPVATTVAEQSSPAQSERNNQLASVIIQRIESRLPGRIRKLAVRIEADTVVLTGQCATYYTKQLAQHTAMGVLEDEHLENAITVSIGH